VPAVADRALDRGLGIRTGDFVTAEEAGVAAPNRVWHTASSWIGTWRSLRALRATSDDVMLDYGAGLGRTLVVASRLPFRRIVGVEVSPRLAAAAKANVARSVSAPRRADVEVVVADAVHWDVPDDITVVYLYCPFTGPVFSAAIGRLLASVDRRPRRVRLVYNNPVEHNFLLSTRRFRPVAATPDSWPRPWLRGKLERQIVTYEVLPGPVNDPIGDPARLGAWATSRDTMPIMPVGHEPATWSEAL
jgi:SAM-dependent methyltransferase